MDGGENGRGRRLGGRGVGHERMDETSKLRLCEYWVIVRDGVLFKWRTGLVVLAVVAAAVVAGVVHRAGLVRDGLALVVVAAAAIVVVVAVVIIVGLVLIRLGLFTLLRILTNLK